MEGDPRYLRFWGSEGSGVKHSTLGQSGPAWQRAGKEAGPGRGPGGQGRSLDAQVRGKGRMQRAQGWGRVQLGLDLLG